MLNGFPIEIVFTDHFKHRASERNFSDKCIGKILFYGESTISKTSGRLRHSYNDAADYLHQVFTGKSNEDLLGHSIVVEARNKKLYLITICED